MFLLVLRRQFIALLLLPMLLASMLLRVLAPRFLFPVPHVSPLLHKLCVLLLLPLPGLSVLPLPYSAHPPLQLRSLPLLLPRLPLRAEAALFVTDIFRCFVSQVISAISAQTTNSRSEAARVLSVPYTEATTERQRHNGSHSFIGPSDSLEDLILIPQLPLLLPAAKPSMEMARAPRRSLGDTPNLTSWTPHSWTCSLLQPEGKRMATLTIWRTFKESLTSFPWY